jgi:RND family efflux transporter MFP subunit
MTEHRNAMRTRTGRVLAATLALAACLVAGAGPQGADMPAQAAASAMSTPAGLPGITKPGGDVTLAAPMDGRVMSVLVEEGSLVGAGDVIAAMDDRVARAAVALAEAEAAQTAAIDRARAELSLASRDLARLEESARSHAASASEIDRAENLVSVTKATLDEAIERQRISQRRLELERARLEDHYVRAPFAGVVVRVDAEEGAAVNLAEPIARVVSLDTLEADLHLPAGLYGGVEAGDGVELSASEPFGSVLRATVAAVEPIVDAGSRTFRCRVRIDNPGRRLPAGFVVRLSADEAAAVAVRADAARAARLASTPLSSGVDR